MAKLYKTLERQDILMKDLFEIVQTLRNQIAEQQKCTEFFEEKIVKQVQELKLRIENQEIIINSVISRETTMLMESKSEPDEKLSLEKDLKSRERKNNIVLHGFVSEQIPNLTENVKKFLSKVLHVKPSILRVRKIRTRDILNPPIVITVAGKSLMEMVIN